MNNIEKEALIAEKDAIIAEKDAIIAEKDAIIADYDKRYNELNALYVDVINSFFWRLTSPLRRVMQSIKNVLTKKEETLKLAIYLKGFLRGGFKGAKAQIENYNIFKAQKNILGTIDYKSFEISDEVRGFQENYRFSKNIKFSILVPLYNTPEDFLIEMIDSVQKQTYSNWELCLADGSDGNFDYVQNICKDLAKQDSRIRYKKLKENMGISDNTNACISMASGDFIALFDHDDLLHPSALFEMMRAIEEKKADFVYTDEATFQGETSNIVLYHFKSDYAPDTLRSYNYICHFTAFSKRLLNAVGGGFNREYDGSQDYDLILRLTEKAKNIVHIPKILYFWRSHAASVASAASAKPYVVNAAEKALAAHIKRLGLKGTVKESYAPTTYKIDYEINGEPLVSIVIPNKDHINDLEKCLNSIFTLSTYKNYEIVIVENNSEEKETFEYYEKIKQEHNNVKVVVWSEQGFNYSAINNYAVRFASGEYVLLLNNDIEVITPNWIEEMLMFAQRKDVGAVGSMLYYPDDTIQHAGVIVGVGGVAGHSHKNFRRNDYGYVSRACISQNLSACTAACLLIRKDVFDEVQGLDEGFAVAFNDVDLCMKIRAAGYLIVFTPYAEFYHYESKSRGLEDSPQKVARFNGEINRFVTKWQKELEAGDPYYNPNLTLAREDFSLK